MPSPLQTRLQACLVFYQRVSLCILWWTIDSVFFSSKSNQDTVDTTRNTSIDDTVKFVLETRKRLWKSAVEIVPLTRGFKYKPC